MGNSTRGRRWIFIGLLFLLFLRSGAESKGKMSFGIYGGKSFTSSGVGTASKQYITSSHLIFHLGGYIQYNVSDRISLQLNVNYQGIVTRTDFQDFSMPLNEPTITKRTDLQSCNLNVVFNYLKLKNARFYLFAGPGITAGAWYLFDESYYNIMAGTGVKICLAAASRPAINLGGTFRRLWDPKKYSTSHQNYLSCQIGLEF